MAISTLDVKRGDLLPLPATVLKHTDGTVVDLTSATVRFIMRPVGASSPKVAASAAVIGSPVNGSVMYAWIAADTDTVGVFRAEWEVTFPGAVPQTFPTVGYLEVRVFDDLSVAPLDPAFCTPSDLLLGDLELASSVKINDYIIRAARDMQVTLAQKYVTPIVSTSPVGKDVLRLVNADLAASYIITAVAQGGEDNRVNAYGVQLWTRANSRLMYYMDEQNLPGVTLLAPASSYSLSPVGVTQEDSGSGVAAYYNFVQNPLHQPPAWPFYFDYRG